VTFTDTNPACHYQLPYPCTGEDGEDAGMLAQQFGNIRIRDFLLSADKLFLPFYPFSPSSPPPAEGHEAVCEMIRNRAITITSASEQEMM
jgi:hypothetical protein